ERGGLIELLGEDVRLVEALPGGQAALRIARADDGVGDRDDAAGLLATLLRDAAVDVPALLPGEVHIRHHCHGRAIPFLGGEPPGLSLRPFARWQMTRPSDFQRSPGPGGSGPRSSMQAPIEVGPR